MFCLIKTENNNYSVIPTKTIKIKKGERYIKRAGHNVEVVSRSDKEHDLKRIAMNLEKNILRVEIKGRSLKTNNDLSMSSSKMKHNMPMPIEVESFDEVICKSVSTLELSNHDDIRSEVGLSDHDYSCSSYNFSVTNLSNNHLSQNQISNSDVQVSPNNLECNTKSDNDDQGIKIDVMAAYCPLNKLMTSTSGVQLSQPTSFTTVSGQTDDRIIEDDQQSKLKILDFTLANDTYVNNVSDETNMFTTEIFLNKVNSNVDLQSKISTSIDPNKKIHSATSSEKPKIRSHLVGEFISNKSGVIQSVQCPNSYELYGLADIPIMLIDNFTSKLNITEQSANLDLTQIEDINSLAVLENCKFIEDDSSVKTESSSMNPSLPVESNIIPLKSTVVNDSDSKVTNNNDGEYMMNDNNVNVDDIEADHEDKDSDCGSCYNNDENDSDSSSSFISELEDLDDDIFGIDRIERDAVIRDKTSSFVNETLDLSIITEKIDDSNLLENKLKSSQNNLLNDTNLSSLALTEQSRLSCSTQNKSMNDSSYIPTPDVSLDQTNEFSYENSALENLDDSDDDSVVEEMLKKSKPPDLKDLKVPKSGEQTKKSFCCFCFQFYVVISRHFEAMHSDEKEVQDFLALKKRSPARMAAIENLRLKGNKLFNLNEDFNHGQLLVTRQPQNTSLVDATDFKPCHKCGKWLQNLNRHKCLYGKDNAEDRSGLVKSKIMMGQFHENATSLTRKILAINNNDAVSEIVRKDPLLVIFVNELSEKYTNSHQHSMIRSRVRMLGNILLKMKDYNQKNLKKDRIYQKCNVVDIKLFSDIIDPRLYDNFIIAVQNIVGADAEKNKCKAPSTATAAGTWTTKIAKVYEKELIKQLQYKKAKNVSYFLKIHEVEFRTKINCLARNVQTKQKRHTRKPLPTMADINKFRDFVESHLVSAYSALIQGFNYRTWKLLSQMTLIYVLLFNRKRPGELERVSIDDYKSGEKFEDTNPEEYARLSDEEKTLVDEYIRFELGGKKGRDVPLIISKGMQNFIQTIIDHRSEANVDPDNPFVFGMPGFDGTRYKHLEACVLMRRFSKLCDAEHPERLRATQLRKHFATTVASLQINECQIYDVSNFMGHAEKIHRDYYRQSVVTRDLCGVSKILEVASGVPSTVKRAGIIPDESDPSCSNWSKMEDDSLNMPTISTNDGTKVVSSSNCSDEESCDDSYNVRFSKYKKVQAKKRRLEYESSSEDELEQEKHSVKRGSNQIGHKTSSMPEVALKRNNMKKGWSNEERNLVLNTFAPYIKNMKIPPASKIKELIVSNPVIQNRTEAQIRTYVHNQIARKLRELKGLN